MSKRGGVVSNYYRDLRERRLLPVVAILAIAIVAVPILLRSDPEPVPSAPPVAPVEGASEAVPAVMLGSEGIRNYRKRLDVLRSKNPFTDYFAPLPQDAKETGEINLAPEQPAPGPTEASTAIPPTSPPTGFNSSTETGLVGGVGEAAVTDADSSTPSDPETGGSDAPEVITKEYRVSYRADVLVGPAGDAKQRTGVKMLRFLPAPKRPVVVFVGVTEDDENGVFMLSTDVTRTSGEGRCSPSATNCQFVTIARGERRTLTYAPEGVAAQDFTLELTGIELVVVKRGDAAVPDDADGKTHSASVPSGMAAWLGLDG